MAVLRQWLDEDGFDWESGRLVLWPGQTGWPDCKKVTVPIETKDHADLDKEFRDGFGATECPSFVAFSGGFIFFPSQYDGSTNLEKFPMTPEPYLSGHEAPYPGG